MYKVAAEREAGFIEQVVMPLLKQRNPAPASRRPSNLGELAGLGEQLRSALLRSALRDHTDLSLIARGATREHEMGSVLSVAIEMELVGIELELPANIPCLLLREAEGDRRVLPIFIGGPEATAIAFALEEVETPRPMTHDLMKDLLDELGATLERVVVTELRDATFYAEHRRVDRRTGALGVGPAVRRRRPGRALRRARSSPRRACSTRPAAPAEERACPTRSSSSSRSSSTR